MSDYNRRSSYWQGKDSLSDSDPEKIISGDDFDDEFELIETAINTKADVNGSSTEAFSALSLTLGGTAITSTAAELNILDGVTSTATEINLLDGITAINDEDDMTSDSDTSLATQQSIKAYVDAQVAAATMTWTYVTRETLSTAGSYGSYSTVNIPSSITSQSPSALIISVYLDTDDSSVLTMYFKSSSVSERIMGYSVSDNNSDDSSGSFNTFTVPYTSTVDIKWTRGGTNTSGYVYIDGYIS